jgi:hypothetical protein
MGNKSIKFENLDPKIQNKYKLYLGKRGSFERVEGLWMNDKMISTQFDSDIVWSCNEIFVNLFTNKKPHIVVKWPMQLSQNQCQCWCDGETLSDVEFLNLLKQIMKNLKNEMISTSLMLSESN